MAKKLVKIADDSACLVCGSMNPIGLKAKFTTSATDCSSHSVICLPAEFQGWQDVVHGGIIAALLDEACIYACHGKADQCVTADLQIRYRKPVPVGTEVEISGQLTDSSRKMWLTTAKLKVNNTVHAEAQAKIFILDP